MLMIFVIWVRDSLLAPPGKTLQCTYDVEARYIEAYEFRVGLGNASCS